MSAFFGRVENGKAQIFRKEELEAYFKKIDGKHFRMTIAEEGTYSDEQWGYLHACLGIMAKSLNKEGNNLTIEILKDMLRERCPELRVSEYVGGIHLGDRRKSTKELSMSDMASVITALIAWADEWNIHLPPPREQLKADL